jgi:hypothetical protein
MADALSQRITGYTVWVAQTTWAGSGDYYYDYTRAITLRLEYGQMVNIYFPSIRPQEWLSSPATGVWNLYLTADQYDDVYHILQTEDPAYCTVLTVDGLQVGSVHTDFPGRVIPPVGPVPPEPPVQYAYPEQSMEARVTRGMSHGQEPTAPGS